MDHGRGEPIIGRKYGRKQRQKKTLTYLKGKSRNSITGEVMKRYIIEQHVKNGRRDKTGIMRVVSYYNFINFCNKDLSVVVVYDLKDYIDD